jgi:DNA-binding MarR family transcriptional regulator
MSHDNLAGGLRLAVLRLNRCLRHQWVDSKPAGQVFLQHPDSHPTLSQLSTLSTLHTHGPMTPGALAALEQVAPPSMTRTITSLEAAGLITRTSHPADRRQAILTISDTGADYIRHEINAREVWLHHRLTELDDTDRRTLRAAITLLDRLTTDPVTASRATRQRSLG